MNSNESIIQLETILGYKFKNPNLCNTALTHSSYVKDIKDKGNPNRLDCQDYERLEFLGDSILSLIISEYLYNTYLTEDEGVLSKVRACVVRESSLGDVSTKLGIYNFIRTGRSEYLNNSKIKISIMADVYEAILAAIYLDSCFENAQKFVMTTLKEKIDKIVLERNFSDYKTQLQEFITAKYGDTVSYEIVNEQGPDHAKMFDAVVKHNSKIIGSGTGKSKKEAEQSAAQIAILTLLKHAIVVKKRSYVSGAKPPIWY